MKLSNVNNRPLFYMKIKKDSEYIAWYQRIVWKEDSIILLDGRRIPKNSYVTPNGFDSIGFSKMLKDLYLKEYAK